MYLKIFSDIYNLQNSIMHFSRKLNYEINQSLSIKCHWCVIYIYCQIQETFCRTRLAALKCMSFVAICIYLNAFNRCDIWIECLSSVDRTNALPHAIEFQSTELPLWICKTAFLNKQTAPSHVRPRTFVWFIWIRKIIVIYFNEIIIYIYICALRDGCSVDPPDVYVCVCVNIGKANMVLKGLQQIRFHEVDNCQRLFCRVCELFKDNDYNNNPRGFHNILLL